MGAGRRYSMPYRDLQGHEIAAGTWHIGIGGGDPLAISNEVHGWDYLTRLELRRKVEVRGSEVVLSCNLGEGAQFALIVTAHCAPARFREVVFNSGPLARMTTNVDVHVVLDDCRALARELRLDTEVVLIAAPASRRALVASDVGSRLYSDSVKLQLEGSGARLPVETADLSSQIPGLVAPDAPWHVMLETTDLHAPVMQSLRVFINSRSTPVANAVREGDIRVLALLKADVARRLLTVALQDDEFVTSPDVFAEGSTGEAARRLLSVCLPGLQPVAAQNLAMGEPARFESLVQSAMALVDV